MALISCPNCGKEISDKAFKCPQCGYVLNESAIDKQQHNVCEECGTIFPLESTFCPNCGCPVTQLKTTKKKSMVIPMLVIIAVILAAVFGIRQYQNKRLAIAESIAASEAESIRAESEAESIAESESVSIAESIAESVAKSVAESSKAAELANYKFDFVGAVITIDEGIEQAETDGYLIRSVWGNSIKQTSDPKTDKFTKQDNGTGAFYSDFNDALNALFADDDFNNDLTFIYGNQKEVDTYMKKLKNPPDEFSEEYDALKKYHESYMALTNMVLNPLGSYNSYSEELNATLKEVLADSRTVTLYLDDEKNP